MKKIKRTVFISKYLYEKLIELSKNSYIEECGIFLGNFQNSKIEIYKIIQDKINQFGTRTSTIRQTKNIYKDYEDNLAIDNLNDYIGEWHTHPLGKAKPSRFDNIAMKFLLNNPKYGYPKELILGIVSSSDGLRIFLYHDGSNKIKKTKLKIK